MMLSLPIEWLPALNRRSLRADTLAGLVGAAILLPQAMAYAVIAGLPPIYGIYCAIVPAIIAALFGSSRQMVSGPAAPISIVVFAAVAVELLAEIMMLPLLIGFSSGVALMLIQIFISKNGRQRGLYRPCCSILR